MDEVLNLGSFEIELRSVNAMNYGVLCLTWVVIQHPDFGLGSKIPIIVWHR